MTRLRWFLGDAWRALWVCGWVCHEDEIETDGAGMHLRCRACGLRTQGWAIEDGSRLQFKRPSRRSVKIVRRKTA